MKSLLCFDLGFVYARFLEYLEKHTSESTGVGSSSGTQASTIDTGVNDLSITFTKTRRPGEGQTPSRRSGKGKWPTGSGGFHPSGKRPTQETLEEIGQAGELYVYKKLKEKYIVEWVSVNAELLGYIAKGDDSLGYDMRYADENGNINYIEVKSTSGEAKRFHISTNEVVTGIGLSENYKLIFVVNALDSPSTKAFDLGYIFKGYTSVGEFVNSDSLGVNASEYLVLFEELPEIQ